MKVRSVQQEDEDDVYALLCELENETLDKSAFLKGFSLQIKDDTIVAWVLQENNRITGYISLRLLYHLHHCAYVAMIEELVVEKTQRHKGYGGILFQQALTYANQHACIQLELSSKQTRKAAHHFYQQQGMHCEHFKFTIDILEKMEKN